MQYQEKKSDRSEYFQTQWRKHVDKVTIPPKQTPVYLAVSKGPSKEKKHRTGESHADDVTQDRDRKCRGSTPLSISLSLFSSLSLR